MPPAARVQPADRARAEAEIRRLVEGGDLAAATKAAVEAYGREIYRFILAMHGASEAADDAFSLFSEGIWRGIGAFDWRCSFRTWAYGVARRASLRSRRDAGRRARREQPLEAVAAISAIEDRVRTTTRAWLKTAKRNRFAEIRDGLPLFDRELLVLRVDRGLSWNDCAHALHDGDDPLDAASLQREAARLRKRFSLLKRRLLEIGRREGLVDDPA